MLKNEVWFSSIGDRKLCWQVINIHVNNLVKLIVN
jgi:hypothetical protein